MPGTDEPAGANPPYTFSRTTDRPTDTLLWGTGGPARRTGLLRSPFRPSDDATTLAFPIASNAMVSVSLKHLAEIVQTVWGSREQAFSSKCSKFSDDIRAAIMAKGVTPEGVFAYEVDGFGNYYKMDDAGIPSLLSLPYLGFVLANDTTYLKTRDVILSTATNPYFFKGTAASGVGSPHVGLNFVWPMSIVMQGWTALSDAEILTALETLKASALATGFIHESFNVNDPSDFTRPWFAWMNSLFGDFILHLADTRPNLIF